MDTEAMLERANLLLQQKRFSDAEQHVRKVLEEEPNNDYALSILGRCYLNSKKTDQGIETIQRAIALNPNESFYFYLLGFGYYQKSSYAESARFLDRAIRLNPYAAEYFGLLAFVLIDDKKFEAALEKANEGLALEADNLTCLNARSTALNKLRRTDDAIETMNTALAQDPDSEVTHSTIGWNLLERGRHKEAQDHFMEALRIHPNFTTARTGLKEALKSKILLYKWLLQYSFWVNNKGRNVQVALPIILYFAFRVLISFSESQNSGNLTWVLVGVYIFIVVISWTIGSIANFVLLFHPLGRHALNNTEKWSAITSVSALIAGILTLALSGLADGTPYAEGIFFAGTICVSLALPLGQIEYPVQLQGKKWKKIYAVVLAALGLVSLLVFAAAPAVAMTLFAAYGIAFVIYNWAGIAA